jgi:hypothetical protein
MAVPKAAWIGARMKYQVKPLGESDPEGCIEAEKRRTKICSHPPVAELHRLWCSDCLSESTDDGKVVLIK